MTFSPPRSLLLFLFFPPFSSISILLFPASNLVHILLSPPVSSTCPSPTPRLPCSFSFPLPHLTFAFLLFYLKIALHLRNHSIFPPPPFHSFCLELGQLKATEEKKQKLERVCVSHQITTEKRGMKKIGEHDSW